jgi:hypothetical protein
MKPCSRQHFHLESFGLSKMHLNLSNLKCIFLQTSLDEKSNGIKVVEHKELFNFVFDNFFV